jgi:alanine dehydrogenase
MTLLIDERDVADLISIDEAISIVSEAFVAHAQGRITNMPRQRLRHRGGTLRVTGAVSMLDGFAGVKVSSSAVFDSHAGRVMSLHDLSTGGLAAVIQVFRLGALRTGSLSGVATRTLAREDASVLCIIGTGRQARTQLAAIETVRPLRRLQVYGRNPTHLQEFVEFIGELESDVVVQPCGSAREAVEGADIVVTATSATQPVLLGEWLEPGMHINAIGANDESRRELDSAVVAMADLVAVDEPHQARYEASDLIHPVQEGVLDWAEVRSIGAIIAGHEDGRKESDQITLFKSLGTAIGDVALAVRIYERAVEAGRGIKLPDLTGLAS